MGNKPAQNDLLYSHAVYRAAGYPVGRPMPQSSTLELLLGMVMSSKYLREALGPETPRLIADCCDRAQLPERRRYAEFFVDAALSAQKQGKPALELRELWASLLSVTPNSAVEFLDSIGIDDERRADVLTAWPVEYERDHRPPRRATARRLSYSKGLRRALRTARGGAEGYPSSLAVLRELVTMSAGSSITAELLGINQLDLDAVVERNVRAGDVAGVLASAAGSAQDHGDGAIGDAQFLEGIAARPKSDAAVWLREVSGMTPFALGEIAASLRSR